MADTVREKTGKGNNADSVDIQNENLENSVMKDMIPTDETTKLKCNMETDNGQSLDEEGEEDEDDWGDYSESGEDEDDVSDLEDVNEDAVNDMLSQRLERIQNLNPELPKTTTLLKTPWGSKIYLVGTAHFSHESQRDVAQTISATQPDVVMVELCPSRENILHLDEETLLEEAKNINLEKIRQIIKEAGIAQGITYLLLLNMSAHVTKELGMAPGGEFRQAFKEAQKVPNCRLQLGDRPIQVTVKRVLGSLTHWQTLKLIWRLIWIKEPISKEDVEKFKNKDLLEQMLKAMAGEFPGLSQVVIKERDMFLTNSLKIAASLRCPVTEKNPQGIAPTVVVGVVGMGHVPGIEENWKKEMIDIMEIMKLPPTSICSKLLTWCFRMSVIGVVGLGCYRLYLWTAPIFF